MRTLAVAIRNTLGETDSHTSDIGHWFGMTHRRQQHDKPEFEVGEYPFFWRDAPLFVFVVLYFLSLVNFSKNIDKYLLVPLYELRKIVYNGV